MPEPMSPERLAEIRTWFGVFQDAAYRAQFVQIVGDLLTEVDRLTAAQEPPKGTARLDWASQGVCICGHHNYEHTPRQSASCYIHHCSCQRYRWDGTGTARPEGATDA